jgi:hypothetical protein
MARLGPLAQLDLDHPDLVDLRGVGESVGIERAVILAAPEIPAADLPD